MMISATYGGLLEGYPSARMNDALVARLGRRREFAYSSQPAHVIAPPRLRPEPGSRRILGVPLLTSLPQRSKDLPGKP